MKSVITDDKAVVDQMLAMAKHFDVTIDAEEMSDGQFRLTMSEEDAAKFPKVDD